MDFLPIVKKTFENTSFVQHCGNDTEKSIFENDRLYVPPSMLQYAAETAFREISFYFRETHLKLLAQKLEEPDLGRNDRMVITMLLENAISASGGEFCLCQDTGAAIIYGWKDENVHTGHGEREALEAGVAAASKKNNLRSSIIGASSFFDEYNTGNNNPAQIHIESVSGSMSDNDISDNPCYRLLFIAKGGGSSNKTKLFSMSKSLLEEKAFNSFLEEQIVAIGTAACPPYRLAVVAGGISPEQNLEAQKLAASEILDASPYFGDEKGSFIYRDKAWEERAMEIGSNSGLGAQFGGTGLLLDARVLRLPRHAASCHVSIGVSCAAHRCLLARIDRNGLFIEKLIHDPASFLAEQKVQLNIRNEALPAKINLDKPIKETLNELSALKKGDPITLSGKLLVARDAAHLKWHKLISEGKGLPDYLLKYPVYYAGPAATPPGKISGSLGPTTAERMDPYGEELMSRGASLITLAKGERSPAWTEACKKYGGAYLGTVGGAAALLAQNHISGNEILDYPELGMEAVRLVTVKDMPSFKLL